MLRLLLLFFHPEKLLAQVVHLPAGRGQGVDAGVGELSRERGVQAHGEVSDAEPEDGGAVLLM